MSVRTLAIEGLPRASRLEPTLIRRFPIDSSGCYLHWPDPDVYAAPSRTVTSACAAWDSKPRPGAHQTSSSPVFKGVQPSTFCRLATRPHQQHET